LLESLDFRTCFGGEVVVVAVNELFRLGEFVVGLLKPMGKGDDLEKTLMFATERGQELGVADCSGIAQFPLDGGGTIDRRRETCADAQVVFFPTPAYF
jgi:hypothetical protein